MLKPLSLLAVALLCSCAPTGHTDQHALIAFSGGACPLSIGEQYQIHGTLGPDYTICALEPVVGAAPRAEIRVGGVWGVRDRTLFAGFSNSSVGRIAWYLSPPAEPGGAEELWAYIPSGLSHPDAVQLLIYQAGPNHADASRDRLLEAIIKASMRPNNSSKPTPLRGAA